MTHDDWELVAGGVGLMALCALFVALVAAACGMLLCAVVQGVVLAGRAFDRWLMAAFNDADAPDDWQQPKWWHWVRCRLGLEPCERLWSDLAWSSLFRCTVCGRRWYRRSAGGAASVSEDDAGDR